MTYNKFKTERKKSLVTRSARLQPVKIEEVVYKSTSDAAKALNLSNTAVKHRCLSDNFKEYILLPKKEKLTEEELKELKREISRDFNEKNSKYFSAYYKNKRKTDIQYKLKAIKSHYIADCLRKNKNTKEFQALTGTSVENFRQHILDQCPDFFELWGRGKGKMSLDHIVPVNQFDLTKVSELLECYHYTNYRPYSWRANNQQRYR